MKNTRPSIVTSLFLFIICASLVYFVSTLDGHMFQKINKYEADKAVHFVEYLAFAFLAMRLMNAVYPRQGLIHNISVCVVVMMLFAVSDEVRQLSVPNRCCDLYDLISDIVGASTGILVVAFRAQDEAFMIKRSRRV